MGGGGGVERACIYITVPEQPALTLEGGWCVAGLTVDKKRTATVCGGRESVCARCVCILQGFWTCFSTVSVA